MPDINATLQASRRLAIQVNPRPYQTHLLTVLANLRLSDETQPEGIGQAEWKALLDHFDGDSSVGLQRGVFYIAGDVNEVDRFEAAALLQFLADYFEPADELTWRLKETIERGEV